MEIKKAPHADLERGKGLNLLLGLVVALSVLFAGLEWRSFAEATEHNLGLNQADIEDTIIVEDIQEEEPPEPEQVQQPQQEIVAQMPEEFIAVDNDKKIDLKLVSIDEDKPLPPPAPVAPPPVQEDVDEIFEVVEENPTFPNGDVNRYLAENIRYPELAQENGIQGRVIIQFVVEKDGSIAAAQVVRGVDASLDKEALRVVKDMPKWKPGKQRGKPVRTKFTLPVQFRLQ